VHYSGQQSVSKLAAHRRADLRDLFSCPKPVKPRHQGGVEARWDRNRGRPKTRTHALGRVLAYRFQYRLRYLLNEQRNAVCALNNLFLDARRQRYVAKDVLDHSADFAAREPIECERCNMRLANPRRLKVWPISNKFEFFFPPNKLSQPSCVESVETTLDGSRSQGRPGWHQP
jgi:hypothetical protein